MNYSQHIVYKHNTGHICSALSQACGGGGPGGGGGWGVGVLCPGLDSEALQWNHLHPHAGPGHSTHCAQEHQYVTACSISCVHFILCLIYMYMYMYVLCSLEVAEF